MKKQIEGVLGSLTDDTLYLTVLLRKMKVRGREKRREVVAQIRALFAEGIPGWFLDDDMCIKRSPRPLQPPL